MSTNSASTASAADLAEKYSALIDSVEQLASAFAVLRRAIEHEDAGIAADVCTIFEAHACAVLDRHSKLDAEVPR